MRVSLAEAAGLSSCGRLFRGDSVDQRQRLMTVRQLVARLFASLACEHLLLSNKPLWRREPEDDDETDGSFDLDFNSGISAAQKNYNLEMTTRPELSLLHPSTLPSPYVGYFSSSLLLCVHEILQRLFLQRLSGFPHSMALYAKDRGLALRSQVAKGELA